MQCGPLWPLSVDSDGGAVGQRVAIVSAWHRNGRFLVHRYGDGLVDRDLSHDNLNLKFIRVTITKGAMNRNGIGARLDRAVCRCGHIYHSPD
ncbi:hypothetical protein DCC24_09830 [Auritidibacter sp. NML100628]|nr:hypothetical protein DCC24_09830 [Auritidibacter sp. NML100628]